MSIIEKLYIKLRDRRRRRELNKATKERLLHELDIMLIEAENVQKDYKFLNKVVEQIVKNKVK